MSLSQYIHLKGKGQFNLNSATPKEIQVPVFPVPTWKKLVLFTTIWCEFDRQTTTQSLKELNLQRSTWVKFSWNLSNMTHPPTPLCHVLHVSDMITCLTWQMSDKSLTRILFAGNKFDSSQTQALLVCANLDTCPVQKHLKIDLLPLSHTIEPQV